MEDSFKVRVDKTFGSLEAPSSSSTIKPTSSSLSSLWCLTDEEIERNKWIQPKIDTHIDTDEEIYRIKNPKPYSPFLQGLLPEPSTSDQNLQSDILELDDEDEEEDEDENRQPELAKPDDHNDEEWNIRSSVGMDCTLDNEEEEDAYDKVAVGKEESADRFYMKNVNDYEAEMDSSNNELPNSFTDVIRDPRANHMAAKLRLKEDDESAKKLSLQVSENNIQESNQIATEPKQHLVKNQVSGSKVIPFFPRSSSSLPDYVRNPSKYTHYTFDSKDDVDEVSNRNAFTDFFNSVKGSDAMETQHDDGVSTDSIKSIIFTPKKKSSDVSMKQINEEKKVVTISIDDNEVCMMDEDEPEIATDKNRSLQKGGRKYRTKGSAQVE